MGKEFLHLRYLEHDLERKIWVPGGHIPLTSWVFLLHGEALAGGALVGLQSVRARTESPCPRLRPVLAESSSTQQHKGIDGLQVGSGRVYTKGFKPTGWSGHQTNPKGSLSPHSGMQLGSGKKREEVPVPRGRRQFKAREHILQSSSPQSRLKIKC